MTRLATSLLLLAALGCAPVHTDTAQRVLEAGRPPARGMRLGNPRGQLAILDGRGVSGPSTRLLRGRGGARGALFGRNVDVSWHEARVEGFVSLKRTHLQLAERDGTLHIDGVLDGQSVALAHDARGARGRAAGCDFQLDRRGDVLVGRSSCDSPLAPELVLAFPEALTALPRGELATYLALMLAANRVNAAFATTLPAREDDPLMQRIDAFNQGAQGH